MKTPSYIAASLLYSISAVAGSVDPEAIVYDVMVDQRLCPSPYCGGFWINAVNASNTTCNDGTVAQACYIVDIDLSQLGITPRQEARLQQALREEKVLLTGYYIPYEQDIWENPGLSLFVAEQFWFDPLP